MSLYQEWIDLAQNAGRNQKENNAFWEKYFEQEKGLYQRLLNEHDKTYSGSFDKLTEEFGWESLYFIGFLDGINTSLKQPIVIEDIDHDSDINLDIDYERLLFNMYEAKAPWLYELEEWEGVLTEDKRHEIFKEWKASKIFVADKKVGPNEPCPCGSGKKYKKCCGRLAE